jgi:hypothetical protein
VIQVPRYGRLSRFVLSCDLSGSPRVQTQIWKHSTNEDEPLNVTSVEFAITTYPSTEQNAK